MALFIYHLLAVWFVALIVLTVGVMVFGIRPEYLLVFALGLLVSQGIDIDHSGGLAAMLSCVGKVSGDCGENYIVRGVFHNPELYNFLKALVVGVFLGWNIHLRMDGVL